MLSSTSFFLTGYGAFEYVRAALRRGADDYLLKPVADEELWRVVGTISSEKNRNARELGVSGGYLSRLFSTETGYTVKEYLTRVRIRAAVELLRESSMQIREVMYRCGYHDSAYFGRVFRQFMGVPPSTFRDHYSPGGYDEG